MITREQLSLRRRGLGGSDISAVVGVNPYKTALDLFHEKVAGLEGVFEDSPVNDACLRGNRLELLVIESLRQKHGLEIDGGDSTMHHAHHPFLMAHVDGLLSDGRILEVKTSRALHGWGEEGTDHIPSHMMCQVQHYMNVLGKDEVLLVLLYGTEQWLDLLGTLTENLGAAEALKHAGDFKLRQFSIKRNDRLIALLEKEATLFWQEHVLKGIPPLAREDAQWAQIRSCMGAGRTEIFANDLILSDVFSLKRLEESIENLSEEKEMLKQKIIDFMGDHQTLMARGYDCVATWKPQERKLLDSKKLKVEKPDIFDVYSVSKQYRVFQLKLQEERI